MNPVEPYATFRSRRGRAVAGSVAVAAVLVFGALAVVLPLTGYLGWSVGDSVAMAGLGLLLAAGLSRLARVQAVPDADGLLVRNLLVTRRVRWADVERVRFAGGQAWAWLDLRDGDDLAVMAVQRADGEHGRREAGRLAALVQAGQRPDGR